MRCKRITLLVDASIGICGVQLEPAVSLDQWLDVLHQGVDFGIAIDGRRAGHQVVTSHAQGAGFRTRRQVISQSNHTLCRDQGVDDGITVSSESLDDRGWIGRHGTWILRSGHILKHGRARRKASRWTDWRKTDAPTGLGRSHAGMSALGQKRSYAPGRSNGCCRLKADIPADGEWRMG